MPSFGLIKIAHIPPEGVSHEGSTFVMTSSECFLLEKNWKGRVFYDSLGC